MGLWHNGLLMLDMYAFISVLLTAYLLPLVFSCSFVFSQAMGKASEQGIIFIEGSGPTYATSTVRKSLKNCILCSFQFLWMYVGFTFHDNKSA